MGTRANLRGLTAATLLTSGLLALATTPLAAAPSPQTAERIEQLETEIVQLKKQQKKNKKNTRRLKNNFKEYRDSLEISGFLSAGLSQSNRDRPYFSVSYDQVDANVSNDISTLVRGKMGLQLNFELSKDVEAIVQILGQSSVEDWNLGAEWAYLSYTPTPIDTLRVGRLRLPLFYQSELIEVGYSYPWVRPPVAAYNVISYRNFDGIDYSRRFQLGKWQGRVKVIYGNSTFSKSNFSIDNNDIYGGELKLSNLDWNIRLASGGAHSLYQPSVGSEVLADGEFQAIALNYDNGQLLVMNEATFVNSNSSRAGDVLGYYSTLGYRIDNWLPYFTYARLKTMDDSDRPRFSSPSTGDEFIANALADFTNQRETTYTLGVRYDPKPGMAVKFEVSYINDFNGTNGSFLVETDDVGLPIIHDYDHATTFDLVVDVTF